RYMMRQKMWWAGALAVVIAASGIYGYNAVQAAGSGSTPASGDQPETAQTGTNGQTLIGMEKAEQLALAEAKGQVESIELDRKRGKLVYEVDIQQDNQDVDVWIDAYTGQSLGVKVDRDDDDDRDSVPGNLINASRAAHIAVQHAKGGTAVDVDLDREDDGRWVYEVDVKQANGETEVEIDAVSGKVLKAEYDKFDDDHDDD
ncbi:PepSY domain-containing protein, partial [Peribacillus sp. NPDC056705]|uniref:PepSY domain-containing protein n=1 Tax=Peribacillus sp. NPDC056705 TaxID=3345918 RepID=UPI0037495BB2